MAHILPSLSLLSSKLFFFLTHPLELFGFDKNVIQIIESQSSLSHESLFSSSCVFVISNSSFLFLVFQNIHLNKILLAFFIHIFNFSCNLSKFFYNLTIKLVMDYYLAIELTIILWIILVL